MRAIRRWSIKTKLAVLSVVSVAVALALSTPFNMVFEGVA